MTIKLDKLENNIYYLQEISKCGELDVKDIIIEVVNSLRLIHSILEDTDKKDE